MFQEEKIKAVLPEWYKVERDAGQTIRKLSSMKELSFYLKNPDEYIRRLAILKIHDLKLKDSINPLKELLDDAIETAENKELAAWSIKSIAHHWNMDLFMTNRLLNKYNGSEKYNEQWGVTVRSSLPSPRFEFSNSLIQAELQLDLRQIRQSSELSFDAAFSYTEWLSLLAVDFTRSLKEQLAGAPKVLYLLCINLLKKLYLNGIRPLPGFLWGLFKKVIKDIQCRRQFQKKYGSSYIGASSRKKTLTGFFRNLLFNLAYILLFPVRLLVRIRKLLFTALVTFCILLAFTPAGKETIYSYTGIEVEKYQRKAVEFSRDLFHYSWEELKVIKQKINFYLME